jgi:hypothetical protein
LIPGNQEDAFLASLGAIMLALNGARAAIGIAWVSCSSCSAWPPSSRSLRRSLRPPMLIRNKEAVDDLQALVEPPGEDLGGLVGSPNVPYSASMGFPSPTPRIARPCESRSRVVTSRASFHGRRRAAGHEGRGPLGGLAGSAAGTAYTASKHGVIGLTRSIAHLYAEDGIRCNAVCPGGVETNIGRTATPSVQWAYQRLEQSFAKAFRMAQPDEIATLVSWLSSDEASNVNGAVITADGRLDGLIIRPERRRPRKPGMPGHMALERGTAACPAVEAHAQGAAARVGGDG